MDGIQNPQLAAPAKQGPADFPRISAGVSLAPVFLKTPLHTLRLVMALVRLFRRVGPALLKSNRLRSARLGGLAQLVPPRLGSIMSGSGSTRLGWARLRSLRLGAAQLGSVPFGSMRPPLVKLGLARCIGLY